MTRDWKYIAFLVFAAALYLTAKLLSPREYDWTISFNRDDKNPYGGYAITRLLPAAFKGTLVRSSNLTLYELLDTLKAPATALSISTSFEPGKADVGALLKNIEGGGHALISADYFTGNFSDTLGISTSDYLFNTKYFYKAENRDSSTLTPVQTEADSGIFLRRNTANYFSEFDSAKVTVLARNDFDLPVTLLVKKGKGYLVLNSTPLIFTNISLLDRNNHLFVEQQLSALPATDALYWTEFYHLGRMDPASPLRVILTHEPLRWAYYITIGMVLLYVFLEMKRKQRIIPVIRPLANTTLEFVQTVGNMHFHENDHHGIALKQSLFVLERIREKFRLSTELLDERFIQQLSLRSAAPPDVVTELVESVKKIRATDIVSASDLIELNKKIENFTDFAFSKTKE